ncbi:MAG: serine/threonine protein kinase [Archangiaceae bacterium]|nr:serine/threonine protein kinase [Archangiaceae bacterium]
MSSSVSTWVPGAVVGSYTLQREIARGGMGEIWLAHQRGAAGFERLVVLKRIITTDDDEAAVQMFLDEARIASHLHHPNIVQVTELGQDGASYYLAMEYLAGQTLSRVGRRFTEQMGRFPLVFAAETIQAAARGLGYAHRRVDAEGKPLHIVHRDVSPQNIMVTYDAQTKVLDFGIARATGRLVKTATGLIKGKVAYMSPEQAMGQPLDARADVFSLGVILFELATGTRLYQRADDLVVLHHLASRAPMPRASERAPVDPALEDIIARALSLDPEERYFDGHFFADVLAQWLNSRSAAERSVTLLTAMTTCFRDEISKLPEFHRATVRTPSGSTDRSLPDGPPKPRTSRAPLVAGALVVAVASAAAGAFWSRPSSPPALTPPSAAPQPSNTAPAPHVDAPALEPVAVTPPPDTSPTPTQNVAGPAPQPVGDTAVVEVPAVVDAGARVRKGRLSLDTDPWTHVYAGARLLGETPLLDVSLPAGTQRLRLLNREENVDTVIEVEIPVDGRVVKKLAL